MLEPLDPRTSCWTVLMTWLWLKVWPKASSRHVQRPGHTIGFHKQQQLEDTPTQLARLMSASRMACTEAELSPHDCGKKQEVQWSSVEQRLKGSVGRTVLLSYYMLEKSSCNDLESMQENMEGRENTVQLGDSCGFLIDKTLIFLNNGCFTMSLL